MTMRFEIRAPQAIQKVRGNDARAYYTFHKSPGEMLDAMLERQRKLAYNYHEVQACSNFNGGRSGLPAMRELVNGETNETTIRESDLLMSKMEQYVVIKGSKFVIIDDVAGAVPNVPAYLAGHPLTMRRRQRVQSEQAPLMMIVDVAPSAGVSQETMRKRGVALLALARVLSIVRPLEIYAGTAIGPAKADNKVMEAVYTKVETAPLDLARACYSLSSSAFARGACFEYVYNDTNKNLHSKGSLRWGFGDVGLQRAHELEMAQSIFPGKEIMLVSAQFKDDSYLHDPEAWLKKYLGLYGGEAFAEFANAA